MRYDAPRGYRIKGHGFYGVSVSHDAPEPQMWWDGREWSSMDAIPATVRVCNFAPCRTVRAFRRHLRKHPHMRGRLVLVSRYYGHNVYG